MLPPVPRRTAPGHGARRYRGHRAHARECAGRVAGPAHAACICGGHSMVAGFFALAAWRAFPARCVLADAPASLFATALRVAPGQRTRRDAQAFTCARTSAHFVGLGGCYRAAIQGVASLEPRGRQSRGSDGFRPIVWHVGACFCCNGDHGPGLAGAVSLEHFWSVGLPCVACATIALRLRFQNDKSRGWILDFRSRTLTPLGLKRQGTVVLHEGCGLSWEPFGNAKGTMFYCRLVLDPGPAGQRIPLTSLTLQRGSRRDQALIDRCLEHLNGRLGLQGVEPRQGR